MVRSSRRCGGGGDVGAQQGGDVGHRSSALRCFPSGWPDRPAPRLTVLSPAFLLILVVGATFLGSALGGVVTAVVFAVVASVVAAILQIRGLGRPKG